MSKETNKEKSKSPAVPLILACLFIYCTYFVGMNVRINVILLQNGVTGTAKIVDILKESNHKGPADYYPVLDLKGKILTCTRDCYFFGYRKGQTVTVRYLKEQSDVFIIDDFNYTWGFLYSSMKSLMLYLGILYALMHYVWPSKSSKKYNDVINRYK